MIIAMAPVVLKGCKSRYGLVTGSAGMLPVAGKPAVIKQFSPEQKSVVSYRVGIKIIFRCRKTRRYLEGNRRRGLAAWLGAAVQQYRS